MVDEIDREDLLDLISVMPIPVASLFNVLGGEIPLPPNKARGLAFWGIVITLMWKVRIALVVYRSDMEEGWIVRFDTPMMLVRLQRRIRWWMQRRGYEQRYIPLYRKLGIKALWGGYGSA